MVSLMVVILNIKLREMDNHKLYNILVNNCKKHDFYGGVDFMKKFSADLKKYATKISNYEKK